MIRNTIIFLAAVGVSLVAATHRWNDSAHAIGQISAKGGSVRHPTTLYGGEDRYIMIATARVLPGYHGDVRVKLQGTPDIPHTIGNAHPVIDLGIRHLPRFTDNTYYGLRPGDRLALWVMMDPPRTDPVCGMACRDTYSQGTLDGKPYCFCSASCQHAFTQDPRKYRDRDHVLGTYHLSFTDVKTGQQVLDIPITFTGKGETAHGNEHVH